MHCEQSVKQKASQPIAVVVKLGVNVDFKVKVTFVQFYFTCILFTIRMAAAVNKYKHRIRPSVVCKQLVKFVFGTSSRGRHVKNFCAY